MRSWFANSFLMLKNIPYLIIATIHLVAILFGQSYFADWSKTLLMPSLLLFIWWQNVNWQAKKLIALAIIFSFFGDVFLIFQNQNPLFFILGLISFLIAHIFYISQNLKNCALKINNRLVISFMPMLIWAIVLLILAYKNAGAYFVPIFVYAIILCALYMSMLFARSKFSDLNWQLLFLGTILFIISDSMIAINRFILPFDMAGFAIMISYIVAQFLIVLANLRQMKLGTSR
jgi:uncharacterized membrane protein YhhN